MPILIIVNCVLGIAILFASLPNLFKLPVQTKQDMIELTTFLVIVGALGFVGWVLLLIFVVVQEIIRKFNSLPWREK